MKYSFLKKLIISLALVIAPLVFCSISCTGTKEYAFDSFAYEINDYNKHHLSDNYSAPFVKIKHKEYNKNLFNDLMSEFHYSDYSGSIRQYMDNDCLFGDSENIKLLTQDKLYINPTKDENGGYRLDYGQFCAYFSDPELGERGYLGKKYGCDSYIFISDVLADKLLDFYELPKNMESYLKLVTDPNYGILSITVDSTTSLNLSINNILYSDKRNAHRILDFSPYYGVINHTYALEKYNFNPCVEIDLRAYPFYINGALNTITSSHKYDFENYSYEFYQYDYEDESYRLNADLAKKYQELYSKDYSFQNTLFIISLVMQFACSIILGFYVKKERLLFYIVVGIDVLFLFIISIIAIFAYMSFLISIAALMALLIIFIIKGRRFLDEFNKTNASKEHLAEFTTISI